MKWRHNYKSWDAGSRSWKPYSEIYDTPFWPSRLRGDYSHIDITPADDEAKAYQADIDEYVKLAKILDTYSERPQEWLKEELRDIKGHYKTPEETKEFLEALRGFITPEMLQKDQAEKEKKRIIVKKQKSALEQATKDAWDAAPDDLAERYKIISDAVQGVM